MPQKHDLQIGFPNPETTFSESLSPAMIPPYGIGIDKKTDVRAFKPQASSHLTQTDFRITGSTMISMNRAMNTENETRLPK